MCFLLSQKLVYLPNWSHWVIRSFDQGCYNQEVLLNDQKWTKFPNLPVSSGFPVTKDMSIYVSKSYLYIRWVMAFCFDISNCENGKNKLRKILSLLCLSPKVWLIVCSCHVTHAFQSESTLYSCLNVKELLARSRREIWSWSDCNWTRTQNHLVPKRTLNHLAKLSVQNFLYQCLLSLVCLKVCRGLRCNHFDPDLKTSHVVCGFFCKTS